MCQLLNEAADYLSIVPETVPCYDEVLGILQKIGKREPQEFSLYLDNGRSIYTVVILIAGSQ